ncbi:RNA polymerase II subunit A C-terminal domain phosphatase SSU72-like [Sycon ciliatum]|uniref:RNA polymerase II subunit A C-terminal domain phosphatase SSU72-like n=1 Tax=Sycon ciliatum TaxID=27933 RepID=UPI0020A9A105|eukprot:scpid88970/ scgid21432/ RNA polymerase II subunit A C-terminal domain phosphatase SSU72
MSLSIAVVCSSNQNRSMEAHLLLSKKGFRVSSYGTGTHVRIPGASASQPNVFSFSTTYDEMYKTLISRDKELYTRNGMLHMLDRNRRIKAHPERFQETNDTFDIVITCEERIYDAVLDDIESRSSALARPVHVINIDVPDNHEDAMLGSIVMCDFCEMLRVSDDIDDDMERVIEATEVEYGKTILHTVAFY